MAERRAVGQRHRLEIERAAAVAARLGVEQHAVLPVDLRRFGGSALTGDIFLAFALAWAEVPEARDVFIGVNVLDASGYPDCRAEYIQADERMANLATKAGVEGKRLTVHAPLMNGPASS